MTGGSPPGGAMRAGGVRYTIAMLQQVRCCPRSDGYMCNVECAHHCLDGSCALAETQAYAKTAAGHERVPHC